MPIIWPKKFLSSFLFLVNIRNFGLNGPNYLEIDQKCIKYPQKVSKMLEWALKSFLFFKQLFLWRVEVSHKVVSYKKRVYTLRKKETWVPMLKGFLDFLTKEFLSSFLSNKIKKFWAKMGQNLSKRSKMHEVFPKSPIKLLIFWAIFQAKGVHLSSGF